MRQEILKGFNEKVVLEPYKAKREHAKFKVSVGTFFLKPGVDAERYLPTGKSFVLTPDEARQLAEALPAIADEVERLNAEDEEAFIQEGKL